MPSEQFLVTFKGGKLGEPGFQYVASIGARSLTEDQWNNELTVEERATVLLYPKLYVIRDEDRAAIERSVRREFRAAERETGELPRVAGNPTLDVAAAVPLSPPPPSGDKPPEPKRAEKS